MFKIFRHRAIVIGTLTAVIIAVIGFILPPRGRAGEAGAPSATTQPIGAGHLSVVAVSPVEAGRYLVTIAGCNDCHTAGWDQSGGRVPESRWLTGVPIGWRGPWGTTYAANLRLYVQDFTPDSWVKVMRARNQSPPMPWTSLHAMSDSDLRAVYAYIKNLGPAGEAMPATVPPNQEPKTPYLLLSPQMPHAQAHAAPGK